VTSGVVKKVLEAKPFWAGGWEEKHTLKWGGEGEIISLHWGVEIKRALAFT